MSSQWYDGHLENKATSFAEMKHFFLYLNDVNIIFFFSPVLCVIVK